MSDPVGTLHVCAVPIGNLRDASPRLLEVLGRVDAIACEDTRTTGRLLDLLGVRPAPRLLAHHDHNERASAAGIVELLLAGRDVALVSDAGTPSVSDPGVEVVRAAIEAGVDVVAIAGPSAVAAAVSIAGARGDGFRFTGFLPRGEAAIEQVVVRHAAEVLVAFESPNRLAATLGVLARVQPDRQLAACRELTKLHEQVARGTAEDLLEAFASGVRGELVLVLDPIAAAPEAAAAAALALAREMVDAGVRGKDATRIAARHVGGRARDLYDLLLAERDRH